MGLSNILVEYTQMDVRNTEVLYLMFLLSHPRDILQGIINSYRVGCFICIGLVVVFWRKIFNFIVKSSWKSIRM